MRVFTERHRLLRGTVCCFLAVILVAAAVPVFAKEQSIDQIKAKLSKIGTGEKARATVKLKNGTVLKGHIGEQGDQDFTIVSKTGTQKISYPDVAVVNKQELNVGIKIAIVAGVVVGILIGIMYATCGSGGCH